MKAFFLSVIALISLQLQAAALHEVPFKAIEGQTLSLKSYKGKTLLIVNIATQCGYTPQLEGLEKLYAKYKSRNFLILGFPSNDFGGQTPESAPEVKRFCKVKYGVNFPLMEKTTVKGPDKHPLFQALLSASEDSSEIKWNFEKFLVQKDGKVIRRFSSKIKPTDPSLVNAIETALKQED